MTKWQRYDKIDGQLEFEKLKKGGVNMGYNELLNRTIHETGTDNLKEKVANKELSLDTALKRIEKFITLTEKRGLTKPIKKH